VGRGGKVVFCGDPNQSDRYPADQSPLVDMANRLADLSEVTVVNFTQADQQRDPLINKILDRL
jgi:phosphate starvation-inducible protein PhoH